MTYRRSTEVPALDFLVIGAMKSGTTTLYHDLLAHPQIVVADKEANVLSTKFVNDSTAIETFAKLGRKATTQQIFGEVSTTYAMLPDVKSVPARAHRVLGENIKIIYLVREPISRCISHHYHMHAWHGAGKMGPDINRCLVEHPQIINYSRYAMQLSAWIEQFSLKSICVIKFEEYVQNREAVLAQIFRFLGANERPEVAPDKVHNQSDGKPVLNGFWSRVSNVALYRKMVRPFLSAGMRDAFRQAILPKAPPRPMPPSLTAIDYIIEQVRDDTERLPRLIGHARPFWDISKVRAKFAEANREAA